MQKVERLNKLKLYFNTLKYLKFSQVYYRVVKRFIRPKPNSVFCKVAPLHGDWLFHALFDQKIFNRDDVSFLNQEGSIVALNAWNAIEHSKLWLYNLHYFDDLNAFDASKRTSLHISLITRWINENPAPIGNGWEPYPTSLRMVNWIKAFLSNITPDQKMLNSLAQQADYLSQDLERHILGNHLFVNAKALIFAGLFFDDANAKRWLSTGFGIYRNELEEQILSDGGNFELTPMYHIIMLVDLLDLLNLFNAYSGRVDEKIVRQTHQSAIKMLDWLDSMSHNDDKISFFNDSAFGIAPENSVVRDYARLLGIDINNRPPLSENELVLLNLVDTGYVSVKSKDYSLIADLAEVGPSYQPGHAHADTLSFELSFLGKRIFVNSGISEYGLSKERLRQRKTEAHNTVVVNGLDSSQVWSGFRVAKRASIVDRVIQSENKGKHSFYASHNGFKKQGVDCVHKREWEVNSHEIIVTDSLQGGFLEAKGYLHLHPEVEVVLLTNEDVKLSVDRVIVNLKVIDAQICSEDGTWHPEFGLTVKNKKLCFIFKKNTMRIVISWCRT